MGWDNLFSFKGRIGRGAFWLIMTVLDVVGFALSLLPVSTHTWVLSTYGGGGESTIGYVTPLEPLTPRSWAFFALYCLLSIAILWVILAAMVKRLHDRGRSGKWVAFILAALIADTAWEAAFSRPDAPLSAFDIASIVFMIPICLIGAWGFFELLFLPAKRDTGPAQRMLAAE